MPTSPTSSEVTQRKYGTIGLILLAVGLLALFETLYSSGNNQILRLIAGRGAIPLASAIILLGLYFTLYRRLAPRLGPHWYPEVLLGFELIFLVSLVTLHLRSGNNFIELYEGKGGGIIGWSIGELMVMGLGRPAALVVLASLGLIALFLIYEYTPLRVFDVRNLRWPTLSLPQRKQHPQPEIAELGDGRDEPQEPVPDVRISDSRKEDAPKPAHKAKPKVRHHQKSSSKSAPRQRRSQKLPPAALLLAEDSGGATNEQAEIQASIIEDTLMSLNVPTEVVEINVGPTSLKHVIQQRLV